MRAGADTAWRAAIATGALLSAIAQAQIATDGTLGAAGSLTGPSFVIPAALGRQAGANLFHSFSQFSVPNGGSAMFSGPGSVANIISRVTGADPSSIDGRLGSTIAGANLFLINPRGILFGAGASLDLSGSFHASTASFLKFADGTRFESAATVPAQLSVAAPEAFGFLGPAAAPITLAPGAQLAPPRGAAVSLVGGPINMSGAVVYTTSADARLIAAQGAGEVGLEGALGAGMTGAAITVSGGGVVAESTPDAAPGRIVIRGGALTFTDASVVSNNFSASEAPTMELAGGGDVRFSSGQLLSIAHGTGRGADIVARGENVRIDRAAWVQSTTLGPGRAGNVDLAARTRLSVIEAASDPERTVVAAQTEADGDGGDLRMSADTLRIEGAYVRNRTFGAGASGTLILEGRDVDLLNGASVAAETRTGSSGAGGGVRVRASERFRMAGANAFGEPVYFFNSTDGAGAGGPMDIRARDVVVLGAYLDTVTEYVGNGGAMSIDAETVTIGTFGGFHGQISSLSGAAATGRAGAIDVRASRFVSVSGTGYNWLTGGFGSSTIATQNVGPGEGGMILVETPRVALDSGWLTAEGYASGRVGSITVRTDDLTMVRNAAVRSTRAPGATGASGNIRIEGAGILSLGSRDATTATPSAAQGGVAAIFTSDAGDSAAGGISIDVAEVFIGPASYVSTKGVGRGDAGDISIRADRMNVRGGLIVSQTGVGVPTNSPGRAGAITLDIAASLEMSTLGGIPTGNSGALSSTSTGRGAAGDVRISAPSILLDGFLVQAATVGAGRGGLVEIRAGDLVLRNGAQVSTGTEPGSTGDAGDLVVQVANRVRMEGRRVDDIPSGLSATTRGDGRGGSIAVSAPTIEMKDRAFIIASTEAQGAAGSIDVRTADIVLANESAIRARSRGDGAAGAVSIHAAGSVELTGGSAIDSEAASAAGGSVDLVGGTWVLLSGSTLTSSVLGGSGAGGRIFVSAPRVELIEGASIAATSGGGGRAGAVEVDATMLTAAGPGTSISTATVGSGAGGTVTVSAALITLADGASIAASSSGSGDGGAITLFVQRVEISSDASVVATSTGTGAAGRIDLRAVDALRLFGGSITTDARAADGGDIDIRAGRLIHLRGGEISTSVAGGAGAGGNIFIDPTFVILEPGSRIVANAFGGPGGNIDIVADYFFAAPGAIVDASSQLGLSGTVTISAPIIDINAALAKLPAAVVDASALLRGSCASRLVGGGGGTSSLVDVGRGGLAASPERYGPSRYFPHGSDAPPPAPDARASAPRVVARPAQEMAGCTGRGDGMG